MLLLHPNAAFAIDKASCSCNSPATSALPPRLPEYRSVLRDTRQQGVEWRSHRLDLLSVATTPILGWIMLYTFTAQIYETETVLRFGMAPLSRASIPFGTLNRVMRSRPILQWRIERRDRAVLSGCRVHLL